jgi:hypothetical protein
MTAKKEPKKKLYKAAERRAFPRAELPALAQAWDEDGNELGRVTEIGGGGLLLNPAAPYARVTLRVGQRFKATFVEPSSGNRTIIPVEVRYMRRNTIGLRFIWKATAPPK